MTLIPFDSPLRNLPRDLNERQKVSYDGIRLAVQMIDVSYQRLVEDLERISDKSVQLGSEDAMLVIASCTGDAWSIVDNASRLSSLVTRTQNLKLSTSLKENVKALKAIDRFRAGFQNIKKELSEAEKRQQPVLGTLSWVWRAEGSDEAVRIFTLVPGSLRAKSNHAVNPATMTLREPIDTVTFDGFGQKLNLSNLVRVVGAIAVELDVLLRGIYGTESGGGADVLFSMEMSFDQTPTGQTPVETGARG